MEKLYRSEFDKKLSGVCGGLGEYFNIDPTLVRLIAIVLFFVTGFVPFVIGYVLCAAIIPSERDIRG